MNNKSETSRLSYKEGPLSAAVITVLSLFCQWLNWFAFEKLDYSWVLTLFTPLILCIMYHFVQLDAGKSGNFSRKFFFIFAVIVPLLIGVILTLASFISNPDISTFNPESAYEGRPAEVIATYSGRFVITSLYLLVFALIDIPLLKAFGGKRESE